MSDHFYRITRRIFLLGSLQVGLVVLLIYPLYRLQVIQRGQYETLSQNNRIVVRPLPAQRGEILDRNGLVLANNKLGFRLVGVVQNQAQLAKLIRPLGSLIDLSGVDINALYRLVQKKPAQHLSPLTIKSNLSWEEVARLELNMDQYEGLSVVPDYVRAYPLAEKAAHILGYVGVPNKSEEVLYALPRAFGIQIGKQGVELALESVLHGREGAEILELNAKRHVVRVTQRHEAEPGKKVRLSLSAPLQQYAAERIAHYESASIVVLDIATGDILAMASHPSFDPHVFASGLTRRLWGSLNNNPYKPLVNKALNGLYAPGSTIKGLFILAALQQNVVKKNTYIPCVGVMMFGGHKYHCWTHKWGGHGLVSPHDAVVRSCDVFMYELALKLGSAHMQNVLKEFGLGMPLPEHFLSNTRTGLVPTPGWKRAVKGRSWLVSDTILMSIGQGYMLSTPLEMALMAARTASGVKVVPSYLKSENPPHFEPMNVSPDHLKFVQKSLFDVVNSPRGTAFRWRITDPRKRMAGKTGTSQVCRISLSERAQGVKKTSERRWEERDHGLYVGYGPVSEPRSQGQNQQIPKYAVCCVVEHGGGGSVAAVVARDVLSYAQDLDA